MSDSFLAAVAARATDAAAGACTAEPRVVLFVRHGQSMHNISSVAKYGDQGKDETLFDAPLSPLGEEQVATLAGHAALATADLAVVSPLTRAVQTLFGAFPEAGAQRTSSSCPPVEVWPSMTEHMTDSCDIGTGASALAARFPSLDWKARRPRADTLSGCRHSWATLAHCGDAALPHHHLASSPPRLITTSPPGLPSITATAGASRGLVVRGQRHEHERC